MLQKRKSKKKRDHTKEKRTTQKKRDSTKRKGAIQKKRDNAKEKRPHKRAVPSLFISRAGKACERLVVTHYVGGANFFKISKSPLHVFLLSPKNLRHSLSIFRGPRLLATEWLVFYITNYSSLLSFAQREFGSFNKRKETTHKAWPLPCSITNYRRTRNL